MEKKIMTQEINVFKYTLRIWKKKDHNSLLIDRLCYISENNYIIIIDDYEKVNNTYLLITFNQILKSFLSNNLNTKDGFYSNCLGFKFDVKTKDGIIKLAIKQAKTAQLIADDNISLYFDFLDKTECSILSGQLSKIISRLDVL
jgi:hypothetical protein